MWGPMTAPQRKSEDPVERYKREVERLLNSPEFTALDKTLSQSNPAFANLDYKQKVAALTLFNLGEEHLLEDLWRLFYLRRIPTIEEFLSADTLGFTAQKLYPVIRGELTDVFAPQSRYRELVCTGSIGSGKCVEENTLLNTPNGFLRIRNPR